MADTARVQSAFPIISTRDLPRLRAFYGDVLGGTVTYEFKGQDGDVVYAGMDIGESHLGLGFEPSPDDGRVRRAISLWFYVDDCDAAVKALRAAGATITEEPADQPWGERVARARDPDGNELIIGARAV